MPKKSGFMQFALITLLVLQSATVIDVPRENLRLKELSGKGRLTLRLEVAETMTAGNFGEHGLITTDL